MTLHHSEECSGRVLGSRLRELRVGVSPEALRCVLEQDTLLYPATLKSVGYFVIPSILKIAFERPSVRQRIVSTLFNQFSSNLL